MDFEILGPLRDVQAIAVGKSFRELPRLRRMYGSGRWRKMKGGQSFGHSRAMFVTWRYIGMKLMESARSNSKSKNRNGSWPRFAVCLENKDNEVSLEIGKIYRRLKPHAKDMAGCVRVVDESGEDYLFPGARVAEITLPPQARRILTKR